ncbi:MAG: type II secretion system secretin GspD [Pseudomonadota bacterium]
MSIPVKIAAVILVWLCCALPLQAETVTLNLKDADISALISTVAEVAHKNFIVDPRVKGKVTVISSRPMDSDEVYQVFLSILKVHGFAAVPTGEVIKIIPDVNAKQDSIPTTTDNNPGVGDEMVTRVVQVDNVAAAQLVPILRPLVPQQGHLAAYPATNVLIISDRADNVERLVSIIRRIDQVSDSEIEVIPLSHASANEVVRVLTTLTRASAAKAAGGGGTEQVLVADERTNSVLLGGERAERLRLRAIISHLDTPLESGGNTDVIYLRYADATEIVKVLMGVGKSEEKDAPQGQAAAAKSGSFDIQADASTNALVISAPPDIMRTLRRVISQLDVRKAQVLVEAAIAEVSDTVARELGVQWIFADTGGGRVPVGVVNFTNNSGVPITSIASAVSSLTGGGTTSGTGSVSIGETNTLLGFGDIARNEFSYAAVLNALARDGNTNILSTPTLVTLDNEEAEILIGENVPFRTGSFTSAAGDATNPFTTISREDVGLKLKIKPQINEGDALRLDIQQEVSSVKSTGSDGPTTSKRSIKTSVIADNGQIVVLGGLIDETVNEGVQKVPLLGDIPLLGLLFKSKTADVTRNNLMVFIHPVILRDNAVAAQYTNSKYNYVRELQRQQNEDGVNLMPGKSHPILPDISTYGGQLPDVQTPAADIPVEDKSSQFIWDE